MICEKQKGFLFNETMWACFGAAVLTFLIVREIYQWTN